MDKDQRWRELLRLATEIANDSDETPQRRAVATLVLAQEEAWASWVSNGGLHDGQ